MELAEYLKVGLMAVMCSMIEDGELDNRFEIHDPLHALLMISRDIELSEYKVWCTERRKFRAPLDLLQEYAGLFDDYLCRYHSVLCQLIQKMLP